MKNIRKRISLFLAFTLILTSFAFISISASASSSWANDGIVDPGTDSWWTSSIRWEQYAPGIDPYFPRATFSLDSIDVIVKDKTYTVPSEIFQYDVILANYDYETNRNYDICINVDYSTNTASYFIDPAATGSNQISYFTDHAIIPVYQVYSDSNGQLFVYGSPLY